LKVVSKLQCYIKNEMQGMKFSSSRLKSSSTVEPRLSVPQLS